MVFHYFIIVVLLSEVGINTCQTPNTCGPSFTSHNTYIPLSSTHTYTYTHIHITIYICIHKHMWIQGRMHKAKLG